MPLYTFTVPADGKPETDTHNGHPSVLSVLYGTCHSADAGVWYDLNEMTDENGNLKSGFEAAMWVNTSTLRRGSEYNRYGELHYGPPTTASMSERQIGDYLFHYATAVHNGMALPVARLFCPSGPGGRRRKVLGAALTMEKQLLVEFMADPTRYCLAVQELFEGGAVSPRVRARFCAGDTADFVLRTDAPPTRPWRPGYCPEWHECYLPETLAGFSKKLGDLEHVEALDAFLLEMLARHRVDQCTVAVKLDAEPIAVAPMEIAAGHPVLAKHGTRPRVYDMTTLGIAELVVPHDPVQADVFKMMRRRVIVMPEYGIEKRNVTSPLADCGPCGSDLPAMRIPSRSPVNE